MIRKIGYTLCFIIAILCFSSCTSSNVSYKPWFGTKNNIKAPKELLGVWYGIVSFNFYRLKIEKDSNNRLKIFMVDVNGIQAGIFEATIAEYSGQKFIQVRSSDSFNEEHLRSFTGKNLYSLWEVDYTKDENDERLVLLQPYFTFDAKGYDKLKIKSISDKKNGLLVIGETKELEPIIESFAKKKAIENADLKNDQSVREHESRVKGYPIILRRIIPKEFSLLKIQDSIKIPSTKLFNTNNVAYINLENRLNGNSRGRLDKHMVAEYSYDNNTFYMFPTHRSYHKLKLVNKKKVWIRIASTEPKYIGKDLKVNLLYKRKCNDENR